MNSCIKYEELISAMLDGELSPEEQQDLNAHLASCSHCRKMHALFLEIRGAQTPVEPPAALKENIMARVASAAAPAPIRLEKERKKRFSAGKLVRWGALAACFALVVFAGLRFLPGISTDDAVMESERSTNSTADYSLSHSSGSASGADAGPADNGAERAMDSGTDSTMDVAETDTVAGSCYEPDRNDDMQAENVPSDNLDIGSIDIADSNSSDASPDSVQSMLQEVSHLVSVSGALPDVLAPWWMSMSYVDLGAGSYLMHVDQETYEALLEVGYSARQHDMDSVTYGVVYTPGESR